ncbi:dynamin family protein [Vibrio furnissii]|uniref:dynamin family protein n=1 Tax=Vibrio furnissii TaxID=29494 RepID=UPI003D7EA901
MNHKLIESLQTLESVAFDIDAAPQTRMQIENLQSSLENKQFYLPVVGQFSAGKSHFINNLLGRDILPTLTTETTSFLTTIRFGEKDKLLIKLNNNQELVLDISMAQCLSQQSISRGELSRQLPELNIDDICSLDIEINSPLLEGGLVLVDTPGINTLHSAHEAMTYEFLPAAQAFLYVSGNQPSISDLNFLERISKFGLDVLFVRTRMDEINEYEESVESVVAEDCLILEQVIDTSQNYFAISNKLEQSRWQDRFKSLQQWLKGYFADDVRLSLERAVSNNIRKLTADFRTQLDQTTQLIEFEYKGDPQQLETDVKQLETELTLQKKDGMLLKERLEHEFSLVKRDIGRELERLKVQAVDDYRKTLTTAIWIESPKKVREYSDQSVKELALNINTRVSERLTQSVESIYRQQNEQLSAVGLVGKRLSAEGFSIEMNIPTLDEVVSKTDDALLAISRQLNSIDAEENELDNSASKLTEDMRSVSTDLDAISLDAESSKEAVNQLSYVPQYITNPGDSSFSKTFSMLGQAVDLAIMFIPTPAAPVKGAMNGKKAVDAVKATQKAIKATQTAKKASTVINTAKAAVDKYKPIAQQHVSNFRKLKGKAQQGANKLANSSDEKEQSLGQVALNSLQLLEAEFWMRKLGENFDEPPSSRIDQNHRRQFEEQRAKAEQEMQSKVQRQLKKLSDMGLLNEKIAYEQKKKELLLQRRSELEAELKSLTEKQKQQQKEQQRNLSCEFYCQQMNNSLSSYIESVKASSDEVIEQFMVKLSLSVMMDSEASIKGLTDQIAELKSNMRLSQQEKEQKLFQVAQLAEKLDSLYA